MEQAFGLKQFSSGNSTSDLRNTFRTTVNDAQKALAKPVAHKHLPTFPHTTGLLMSLETTIHQRWTDDAALTAIVPVSRLFTGAAVGARQIHTQLPF